MNIDKKKIIIVNNNMHIGGVQKALVNLLSFINGKYEVTLFLFYPKGEYLKDIPPNIKVISSKSAYRFLGMTKHDAKGNILTKLARGFYAAIARVFGRKCAIACMSLSQKKIFGYDIAISYLHNGGTKLFYGGCNEFVLNSISATKKIAFLHCDYSKCGANTKENAKQYARFDAIAACSDGCRKSFINACPELENRVMTVRNCHDFESIKSAALMEMVSLSKDCINILTVARLGKEKGVSRALHAIKNLGDLKSRLHYYIIGDGIEKNILVDIIDKFGLNEVVTLCGELQNPYGYMRAADLLLIPSYSEAAPLVIDEAASLGTPILSTATSSAEDMISKRGFGWVCENSVEGIVDGLKELLSKPDIITEKKETLNALVWNNEVAGMQFEQLLNQLGCLEGR